MRYNTECSRIIPQLAVVPKKAIFIVFLITFTFTWERHSQDMGVEEIRAYLSYLATDRKIAASTQNIALSALLFLYRQVLRVDRPNIENIERARQTRHLPVVLTREEVKTLLSNIEGVENLITSLLYGTGMRLTEGLRLRVKDIDFSGQGIITRYGKGKEDRITMLPEQLIQPLKQQLN